MLGRDMPQLHPSIEPYAHGMLDVGDAQSLYWETCGNPDGRPALVLHGGPGSGCTPGVRRYFDPAKFRIVLFDQRNCGRSLPHASDPTVSLAANTTPHLIADIETLRRRLGVERWLVFGSSWGSALGLAYAEQHPERVSALVISHASVSRWADIHWLYHGVGRYFPDAWERFRAGAGVNASNANLIEGYHRLLDSPDPAVRAKAAQDWCDWEAAVISIDPRHMPPERYRDPRFRMVFARIVTHYFSHRCWLEDGQLLRDAARLAQIPGAIVQGRLDLGSPLEGPWTLARAWPASKFVVVDEAGHETTTPGMLESILAAIDRFAGDN
jgi:proline iminopeptidase